MFLSVACRSSTDLLQSGTNGPALQAQEGRTHPATSQPLPGRGRLATLRAETTGQRWRWWNLGLIFAIIFLRTGIFAGRAWVLSVWTHILLGHIRYFDIIVSRVDGAAISIIIIVIIIVGVLHCVGF